MASEVWKGFGVENQAVGAGGITITIPNGDRAFSCSVDNIGGGSINAMLNTEIADYPAGSGVPIASNKAYTWCSSTTQRIVSITLFSADGSVANVSFS